MSRFGGGLSVIEVVVRYQSIDYLILKSFATGPLLIAMAIDTIELKFVFVKDLLFFSRLNGLRLLLQARNPLQSTK